MAVLLGAKPPIVFEEFALLTSQTWTAPRTGTIKVSCSGGGGQGGVDVGEYTSQEAAKCTGGGAGGFSQKVISVKVGDTFTVVVGAGGRNSNTNPTSATAGTAGGESTFADATAISDIDLDSNGGAGGAANNATTQTTVAGGAGGTATGGDINVTGGAGGAVVMNTNSSRHFATGGGAVGVYGVGYAGGGANTRGNAAGIFSTGGGGVGGRGGNVANTTNNETFGGANAGGGAAKASGDDITFTANNSGIPTADLAYAGFNYDFPVETNLSQVTPVGTNIDGEGDQFSVGNNGGVNAKGPGRGGAGVVGSIALQTQYVVSGPAQVGAFAGGGGVAVTRNTNSVGVNSNRDFAQSQGGVGGGGSGGFICQVTNNKEWRGGGGGAVIISYIG